MQMVRVSSARGNPLRYRSTYDDVHVTVPLGTGPSEVAGLNVHETVSTTVGGSAGG
jgi:hypothetical protein